MSFPFAYWYARIVELRIDVLLPPDELENELDALFDRLNQPTDPLFDLPAIDIEMPGFRFRHRVADGEHYIYVEDTVRRRLAGYTIFNRLVELNRQSDRYLRAPHSKYALAYQRRGIAAAIYRWWLDGNRCLISGARQSAGANALWRSLSNRYNLAFVDLRDKTLRYLGSQVNDETLGSLHTRMILMGCGWNLNALTSALKMR